MSAGQEWCLACGAARTRLVPAPDWRIPLLVVVAVAGLLIGGFFYALARLSATAGTLTVTTAAARAHPSGSGGRSGSWPPGLDGYTVILATRRSRRGAEVAAARLRGHGGELGVLSTAEHPQMKPAGAWEVYTGRYPSYSLARAAAARAARHGLLSAHPALVQRPGQG